MRHRPHRHDRVNDPVASPWIGHHEASSHFMVRPVAECAVPARCRRLPDMECKGDRTVLGSLFATRRRAPLVIGLVAIGLSACATSATLDSRDGLTQPANVGDAKIAATAYRESGAYDRDLTVVTSRAGAWMAERIPQVQRPAVVLDIDDTLLTNWEVIKADDFGRVFKGPCRSLPDGPCGWIAWDLLGRSPAIPQSLAMYRQSPIPRRGGVSHLGTGRKPTSGDGAKPPGRRFRRVPGPHSAGPRSALRLGRGLQGAAARGDRGGRLHDRGEYRRPALGPCRRTCRADFPDAEPLLPDPLRPAVNPRTSTRRAISPEPPCKAREVWSIRA